MSNGKVDQVVIHMYRMGTGDCFVLKFLKGDEVTFKMLIDCGCYKRKYDEIRQFIRTLKKDVDGEVDVLVVTHEHSDHVLGFEAGKKMLADGFKAKRVWMAWTEKDGDPKVEEWKKKYGQKKRALALAADAMGKRVRSQAFQAQYLGTRGSGQLVGMRESFAASLKDFAALHVDGKKYTDSLKGMAVVKDELAAPNRANIETFEPGEVIEGLTGLEGVRIFVLGPPALHAQVKKEHGEEGESFEHNKELEQDDLFAQAIVAAENPLRQAREQAFRGAGGRHYDRPQSAAAAIKRAYRSEPWRRIDDDWLFSSGQFALRMNSLTNNLSLVLAFEFTDSGKVMLFPGDAEFGSWASWQRIDWSSKVPGLTTEKLLNRVVFYKVAHHLSHNGTARSVGLDQMTSPDLVAMATLDYKVISNGWKSTMPNRHIIKELLERTKGRTLIMNTDELFFDFEEQEPLVDKIAEHRQRMTAKERRAFNQAIKGSTDRYVEYVLKV